MPDSIMDQIRAQQAAEKTRRNRDAQEAADRNRIKLEADRAKFAREAPEMISILRQYRVQPQRVAMYDYSVSPIKHIADVGMGWLITGVDDNTLAYPITMHVALLEDSTCIPCVPPRTGMPAGSENVLHVQHVQKKRDYWGMDTYVVYQVRRLIGE